MDSPAKMLWQRQASLQVIQQQLTKAQNNLATVVQAAQEQEDWVKLLADQQSTVHQETLQQNVDKLGRLCNLAERYWVFCKRKSEEVDNVRQECCILESVMEKSAPLDCSFNASFETSQLDLSGMA